MDKLKIFEALEEEINGLRLKLNNRIEMRERLKSFSDSELNSCLGIVYWYYKEKLENKK